MKAGRTSLYFDPELITHAKAQALNEKITLTALIEKSLRKYLRKEISFDFGNKVFASGPTIQEMQPNK